MNDDLNGMDSEDIIQGNASGLCGTCTIVFCTLNCLDCLVIWMRYLWVWIGLLDAEIGMSLACFWNVTGFAKCDANILIFCCCTESSLQNSYSTGISSFSIR